MAASEIWNENTALIAPEIQELSDKVAQQVIGIIEMASQEMASQEMAGGGLPGGGLPGGEDAQDLASQEVASHSVASQEEKTPKTFLAYSVPSPGVRYYF